MGTNALFDPLLQSNQDALARLLQVNPTTTATTATTNNFGLMPTMVDDWLADELYHSGLLTQPALAAKQQEALAALLAAGGCNAQYLPQSPPLTASPQKEVHTESPTTPTAATTPISLFPEIGAWPCSLPAVKTANNNPSPVVIPPPARPGQRRPVPIMPKTETTMAAALAAAAAATETTTKVGSKRKSPTMMLSEKEQDEIALKRQRNTDAARRSRLKKLLKMEALEKRVSELEGENTRLTTRVAVLESEKSGLESKDKDLQERIRVLEEQLAEAHKALTARCSH